MSLGLVVLGSTAPGVGALDQSAALLSAAGGSVPVGAVAVSGRTVVAGAASAGPGTTQSPGGVFVFTEPSRGWSGVVPAVAALTARLGVDDKLGSEVAISGRIVVASAANAAVGSHRSAGAVYVFNRPARGWSGTVHAAARLTLRHSAPEAYLGSSVAISGRTIVIGDEFTRGVGGNVNQGAVYVFTEPRHGWKGNLHESAKLTVSNGAFHDLLGSSVGISGHTIIAGEAGSLGCGAERPGAVYVFSQPHRGWSGAIHERATLNARNGFAGDSVGDSAAISGSTVVAGAPNPCDKNNPGSLHGAVYVFNRPAAGWHGTQHETAKLSASNDPAFGLGDTVAVSNRTVVSSAGLLGSPHPSYVFSEPSRGWSTETQTATLASADSTAFPGTLAIAANLVFDGSAVFARPAAGWSGVVQESANLSP